MTTLGQWIKGRRKQLDLTQEELALRVGCSLVLIQKIEEGERRPSKQIADLLAHHLAVPLDERPDFVRFARARDAEPVPTPSAPWRTFRRQHSNLPVQPTPLFGRDDQVAAIRQRLLSEEVRLLTLVGPPGIGKTRLAIEAASRLLDDFSDGVFFVSLAAASDPERVVTILAQVFEIKETSGKALFEQVQQALADRHILLLLDNLEQVVTAAPLVADLLAGCPWLQVLATSRVPLHIRAERQFHVPSLGVPPPGFYLEPQTLLGYPAVAFFVDRARAVEPDFTVTSENAPAIAEICIRLDGLPLAIELVAVRVGQAAPAVLLSQLSDRLGLLTAGPLDLPARQQALRSAIDWSYELLAPAERRTFARLGVFVGGCTVEMAEFACGDISSGPLAGLLTRLVDQSLVLCQEPAPGALRYAMLETIRVYALERLEGAGELEATQQRHTACMLDLAKRAELPQPDWLERLEMEHDNLRAAFHRALHSADAAAALGLAAVLSRFWTLRGYLSEGLADAQAALNLEANPADLGLALLRAQVLLGEGWLLRDRGDFPGARACFEQSLALYQGRQDLPGLAYALYSVGYIQFLIGDLVQGIRLIEESLALYRSLNDEKGLALTLFMLGRIAVGQGDYCKARVCLEECLEVEHARAESYGLARTQGSLGELLIYRGDHARAAELLTQSQALLEKMGERQLRAWVLTKRGELAWRLSRLGEARSFVERGLDLAREIGYRWNEAYSLTYLGLISLAEGDSGQARSLCESSLALFNELESQGDVAQTRKDLARVLLASGEIDRAAGLYLECLATFEERGYLPDIVECLEGLASVRTARCDPRGAARLYGAAQARRDLLGMPLPPVLLPAYQHDIAALHLMLEDDLFDEVWSHGRELSVEQAVQFTC